MPVELTDSERAAWSYLAAQMRSLHDALIEEGFSDGDAMQIVIARAVPIPDLSAVYAQARDELMASRDAS